MQHARRRHRPWRPLSTPTIRRIASLPEDELDRASLERIGLLFMDGSPAALLAAAWEAQALRERSDTVGFVATPSGLPVCRCPR